MLPARLKASSHDAAQPVGAEDRLEHRGVIGSAAQHQPAVDVDHLAGDIAGRIAEQEHREVCDVGDLTRSRERCAGRVVVTQLRYLEDRRNEVVRMRPGRMQFTRTQDGPSSSAASCIRWSMPALETP